MISRITPVVLILIAVGLFFSYINPTYNGTVSALHSEIQSYDKALLAAQKYHDKEVLLMEERKNIPEDTLDRIETFLPNGVDNVQLILDLNALAKRSGLTLSDFDIAESENNQEGDTFSLLAQTQVESLDLSVSAIGSYSSFKTFILAAEQSLRPLDVVELSVQDSETGVYTYHIKFRIYWLK